MLHLASAEATNDRCDRSILGALDDLFVPLPALGTDANGPVYAAVCVTPDIERNQKRIS